MMFCLLISEILAEKPLASTSKQVFTPPSLLADISIIQKVIFSILLGIVIFASVFPAPEYKKYQIAMLNGVALWFGIAEILIPSKFRKSPLIAIISIAAGIILTLRKELKGCISAVAAVYPTSLLLFTFLTDVLTIPGLCIVLQVVIGVAVMFLLAPAEPMLDIFILGVYNAFFAACIFETFGLPGIFTITSKYELVPTLNLMHWVCRIIVICLLLSFFFLPTALKLLKSVIYRNDSKDESV